LIAESTGKHGKGLIPIDGEPLAGPDLYGRDRFFIDLRTENEANAEHDGALEAVRQAGPVARILLESTEHVGQEFFRFELAIATAGAVIGIDPFDQADVEASKIETRELTAAFEKTGALPRETPVASDGRMEIYTDATNADALKKAGADGGTDDVSLEYAMQIGLIGLGRMGSNIARRLMQRGHQAVVYDRDPKAVSTLAAEGATGAGGLEELVRKLGKPRPVWVMLPAGEITENVIRELGELLEPGDIVIDGGNTFWKDDIRRAATLRQRNLHYNAQVALCRRRNERRSLGSGTPVLHDDRRRARRRRPPRPDLRRARARDWQRPTNAVAGRSRPTPGRGYLHAGPNGAGHFVKMVHNGIEYSLMHAYAEGFEILKKAGTETLPEVERFDLDIADIAEVWRRGSVIASWLLDLAASAVVEHPALNAYSGFVQDSGEGRWTIQAAIEEAVPAEVLSAALYTRFRSRQEHTFAEKILSAMRKGFGGHIEPKAERP
jgi:6-phosphogluconate dehydrogenase